MEGRRLLSKNKFRGGAAGVVEAGGGRRVRRFLGVPLLLRRQVIGAHATPRVALFHCPLALLVAARGDVAASQWLKGEPMRVHSGALGGTRGLFEH